MTNRSKAGYPAPLLRRDSRHHWLGEGALLALGKKGFCILATGPSSKALSKEVATQH
ncbi:MAG: hypothetical protein QFX35_06100 [Candidatus Verstraetearchaeota archaeon]|nr:hypothetical protein [Candidatus Verstraetearchaeota archaeon]